MKPVTPAEHLDFLLSAVYDRAKLDPEHLADLRKSGVTDATIALHKIRSVPPLMIDQLLGFRAPTVRSAYIIPFADPRGGFMDHVRLKTFPFPDAEGQADPRTVSGDHVETIGIGRYRYNNGQQKYLVRRHSSPRLFFPIATMPRACAGDEPLWICEGPKKALAVAQLGLPAVGIESAWSWHERGSRALLPDFGFIALRGRTIELVPDGDVHTNPAIASSMRQLADALRAVGGRPRLVRLPQKASA